MLTTDMIRPLIFLPHELSKHVGGYHIIKLHSYTQVHLLVFLKILHNNTVYCAVRAESLAVQVRLSL